jgi:hypothetical protein
MLSIHRDIDIDVQTVIAMGGTTGGWPDGGYIPTTGTGV